MPYQVACRLYVDPYAKLPRSCRLPSGAHTQDLLLMRLPSSIDSSRVLVWLVVVLVAIAAAVTLLVGGGPIPCLDTLFLNIRQVVWRAQELVRCLLPRHPRVRERLLGRVALGGIHLQQMTKQVLRTFRQPAGPSWKPETKFCLHME